MPSEIRLGEIEINGALQLGSAENWEALIAATDALVGETVFAAWAGGEVVGTTTVDGEERPVHQIPYRVYSEPVREVFRRIGALGLIVPFDWVHWEDLERYRDHSSELEAAPVNDSVRMLTAVQRSERFFDGSMEFALKTGLIQAALDRLILWYREESSASY